MNIKEMKALAQIMESSGLTTLSVKEGNLEIHLERKGEAVTAFLPTAPKPLDPEEAPEPALVAQGEAAADFNHVTEIKSPMVGIFYAAASPDTQDYVQLGSKVKKGDVLCIIEAMKLMNEIVTEEDGEIVEICVSTGQVVEYSQVLFKLY